jgi:hypothetical protein
LIHLYLETIPTGAATTGTTPTIAAIAAQKKSVLDHVSQEVTSLSASVGSADRARLDEYLTGLRELERELLAPTGSVATGCTAPEAPGALSDDPVARGQIFLRLIATAFKCDLTRYASFAMSNGFDTRVYPQISTADHHHQLTHMGGNGDTERKFALYFAGFLAYLLGQLKDSPEGAGTVLDNSLIYYGSEMATGSHATDGMPIILAGRAGGHIDTGRHIALPSSTPMAKLFLTMLKVAGSSATTFGMDGSDVLPGIARLIERSAHQVNRGGTESATLPGVTAPLDTAMAPRKLLVFARTAAAAAALSLTFGCHTGPTVLNQLDDARALTADLRVQFNKAADASNRAVMADTDEASTAFAGDAEKEVKLVEADVRALTPALQTLGFPREVQFLQQFKQHFSEYRALDSNILALAVENTNLKAQRLSFGPARQAADSFRDALRQMASTIAVADRCNVEELVAKATLALREIQVLQAPHIAEADDAAMTRMEHEMADLDATARDALKSLSSVSAPGAAPALATALAALDRFKEISAQIVQLSRRNSNVRSLELSLRTKPGLSSACDESLHALQDALAQEESKATR